MGGDFGPPVIIPAVQQFLRESDAGHLILVGRLDVIEQQLNGFSSDRITLCEASEVVAMDDAPSHALRRKKDSSMRVAINLVKEGRADACISAGNTGALMAIARFVLKTLPGIDRPAIITALPTINGHVHMLDLGANVDSSSKHLYQFAVMASELVKAVDGGVSPSIGLLNIGEEEVKGNDQVKQANELLSNSSLNYIGYIEGDGVFRGEADIVVCDGFVGNIALKTTEGVAHMISQSLKESFQVNLFTKLAGLIALPALRGLKKRFDPRAYNGASLLGLQGIVIKSHGSADEFSFCNALKIALLEVEKGVPELISKKMEDHLESGDSK